MVSGLVITLYCCAASANCDVSQLDRNSPSALRGGVSTHLVNFEYASISGFLLLLVSCALAGEILRP
jgi:hypothetical protein